MKYFLFLPFESGSCRAMTPQIRGSFLERARTYKAVLKLKERTKALPQQNVYYSTPWNCSCTPHNRAICRISSITAGQWIMLLSKIG